MAEVNAGSTIDFITAIDVTSRVIQVFFYIVAGAVAILTYRAARYGILNTINTEYHKTIIDRLAHLSDELSQVFEVKDNTHWSMLDEREIMFDRVVENFSNNKRTILTEKPTSSVVFGLPAQDNFLRLLALTRKYEDDPFIPQNIRKLLANLARDRLNGLMEAMEKACDKLLLKLHDPDAWTRVENYRFWFDNEFNHALYQEHVGSTQIQQRVNEIRKAIQAYFSGFDTLPNTRIGLVQRTLSAFRSKPPA